MLGGDGHCSSKPSEHSSTCRGHIGVGWLALQILYNTLSVQSDTSEHPFFSVSMVMVLAAMGGISCSE